MSDKGPRFTVSEIDRLPIADLSFRGIERRWCERFGVRQTVSQTTGELDPDGHVFFPAGVGRGYKRKSLVTKKDTAIIGQYAGLFGQSHARRGRMLILTEGEEDALAASQILHAKGKDYPVCSVPNGAGDVKGVASQLDWLRHYEYIVLVFDQDDAGRAGAERIADYLMTETEVRILSWDSKLGKDSNDLLRLGRDGIEEWWCSLSNARPYAHSYAVPEVPIELARSPAVEGVHLRRFPALDKKLGSLRRGELTTIVAPPGVGKSTLAAELAYEILESTEDRVALMFLEEQLVMTVQRLVALDNNVSLARYRQDPSVLSDAEIQATYDKFIVSRRTSFVRLPKGVLPLEQLLPLLRYYHYAEGCRWFVFDHISYVFSADRNDNERKLIDNVLHDLAAFVTETGAGFLLVAHMKRLAGKETVKDELWDARWRIVDLDAARGSGAFEQLSWNLLTLEPEDVDDPTQRRTRIVVRKNREWGYTGPADVYRMNYVTGRLEVCRLNEDESDDGTAEF